jgi:hypothetical protein
MCRRGTTFTLLLDPLGNHLLRFVVPLGVRVRWDQKLVPMPLPALPSGRSGLVPSDPALLFRSLEVGDDVPPPAESCSARELTSRRVDVPALFVAVV